MRCSGDKTPIVQLNDHTEVYVTSDVIRTACIHANTSWRLEVGQGQRINVSATIMSPLPLNAVSRDSLGSVYDPVSDVDVQVSSSTRLQHLLVTGGHLLDVNIHSDKDVRSMLHLTGDILYSTSTKSYAY